MVDRMGYIAISIIHTVDRGGYIAVSIQCDRTDIIDLVGSLSNRFPSHFSACSCSDFSSVIYLY